MNACDDLLLSRLFCIGENNHTFNEIEAEYGMSSCYLYVAENNASLTKTEAGLIQVIVDENNVSLIEARFI